MSGEIFIPINLEMRRRGIAFIKMTKSDGSDALGVMIESYNNILVFAPYAGFDEFIREAEDQLLSDDPPLPADDIEFIQSYLIFQQKAFDDAAKELRA